MKTTFLTLLISALALTTAAQTRRPTVVADSLSRQPLAGASVFDADSRFIGISDRNGALPKAAAGRQITVRYMGYHERTLAPERPDTILMVENVTELPEVVVQAGQVRMLHILAYVREYSTLTSYTDTVTMFREKMVDFMLPTDSRTRYRGWRYPRVLNSRSYYRLTDATGLDSVCDRFNNHFTWSDWVGIFPTVAMPDAIAREESATDTIFGRYSPTEIWRRNRSRITLDINVLADTASRRWVPNIASFFRNDNIDFETFRLHLSYDNTVGTAVGPLDLTGYSFNIESRGRGHGMFMFNRRDQPFFVSTYTEVYLLDHEYITVREARRWEKRRFDPDEVEIFEPAEAPELQPSTLALIQRVNNIDETSVKLSFEPDYTLIRRNVSKRNFNIGMRALNILKTITGISHYKARKNFKRNWREFQQRQRERNNSRDTVPQQTNHPSDYANKSTD